LKPSHDSKIPKLPFWLLRKLACHNQPEGYAGDIEEEYEERARFLGKRKTIVWIWIHALAALPKAVKHELVWEVLMIKNYLKIALRNIHKNKGYSFLNITGLAMGIGCCLFIGLYNQFELSFDRYHENVDRIYRINLMGQATTAPALAPAMKDNFPEVENVVQVYDPGEGLIELTDNTRFKTRLIYANEQIFNVFSFPLIDGIPETALEMPFSAVIDEDTARNYFRNKNPIGETLNISTRFGNNDFQITGIMKNIPVNSHFDTHIFVSLETFKQYGVNLNEWNANYMHSYLLLTENSDYHAVEKKISGLFKKYIGIKYDGYFLQPLADIYLKSADIAFQMKPGSDINFIYILSFISFLILLIGCVNYVNLFTAHSLKRFKEIGVRRVFGADKSKLVNQFLCESLLMTITAVSLSVAAVCLFINPLSALFGTELNFNMMNIPYFVFLTFGIGIIAMSLSGIYPAFFLSSLKPADIFRRAGADKPGSVLVRNSLVIFQFAISIFLIVASLVITNQVRFIRNKKLGFDRKHIVVLPVLQNNEVVHKRDIIKTEMHKIPGVKASTFSSTLPMNLDWRNTIRYFEGRTDDAEYIQICCSYVDYDFLDVFDLELITGRNFSRDIASDAIAERSFIINEAAARRLGWENPLGKRMRFSQNEMGTVIGVVKDFHNLPLSQRIEPVALMITNTNQRLLSIKIQSENIQETIAAIEKIWDKFANGWPFEYTFMDQSYDDMYKSEIRMKNQLQFFSAIAVFLSCFGLFGLVSFIVERRTKEIGIRKVLGASVFEIIALITRGFTKKIILANLIVWPVAYFFMNKWLQNFAYQVNIGILVFIAASALSLFVFLTTIFFQTYKAAAANPVKSLRHE
jgi:putative ABC transport system permease protein